MMLVIKYETYGDNLFYGIELLKRETGESPVRTRHCNKGATPRNHWETGKIGTCVDL